MIATCCREHCITAAESVLPREIRLDVRITRIGEIAVGCAPDEATFALRVVPSRGLTVGNDRSQGLPRSGVALLLLRAVVASASPRISLVAPAVVSSVAILLRSSTLAAAILLGPLVLVLLVWIGILLLLLAALIWI